jgi:hypothetical protein
VILTKLLELCLDTRVADVHQSIWDTKRLCWLPNSENLRNLDECGARVFAHSMLDRVLENHFLRLRCPWLFDHQDLWLEERQAAVHF